MYQLAVIEGSTTLSNVYSTRFPYTIDAVNPNSGGWDATVQVNVQKGADIVSTKVPFTVTSQAFINKVNWLFCNIHLSQLSVSFNGSNFGASQGTKQVKIGTLPGWAAMYWSNDTIEAKGPFNIVPWTQTYPVTIVDGAQTVSNTVQHRFPYRLMLEGVSGNPVQLPAGSTLTVSVHGLPLTQGGLDIFDGGLRASDASVGFKVI